MSKKLNWKYIGGILNPFKIAQIIIGNKPNINKQIDSIMKNYEVKVLGNDKQVYNVAAFVAAGKDHSDVIGIVFGSPIIGQRVLAFDAWLEKWGESKIHVEERNESQAVQVLCGLEDTKRIVEAQSDNSNMTAAKRCWQYKCGDLQWYLPSLMELGTLFLVRDEINDAMRQLDCNSDCFLPTEDSYERWLWSSSEGSQSYSWSVHFFNGSFGDGLKYDSGVVRAVAALSDASHREPLSEANGQGEQIQYNAPELSDEDLVNMLRQRGFTGNVSKIINL